MSNAQCLIDITQQLNKDLEELEFADPVSHVYRPLDYAFSAHEEYLRRFTPDPGAVVFLGMNPGPLGMAQTGIPFGAISFVKEWMNISPAALRAIGRPPNEHPKKPVHGNNCIQNEVSGSRFWGLMKHCYPRAEDFFTAHFVINYCPLLFIESPPPKPTSKSKPTSTPSGKPTPKSNLKSKPQPTPKLGARNLTPDKLGSKNAQVKSKLFKICDAALKEMFTVLSPSAYVAVGLFAEARLRKILPEDQWPLIVRILHPSPASPLANTDWSGKVAAELKASPHGGGILNNCLPLPSQQ